MEGPGERIRPPSCPPEGQLRTDRSVPAVDLCFDMTAGGHKWFSFLGPWHLAFLSFRTPLCKRAPASPRVRGGRGRGGRPSGTHRRKRNGMDPSLLLLSWLSLVGAPCSGVQGVLRAPPPMGMIAAHGCLIKKKNWNFNFLFPRIKFPTHMPKRRVEMLEAGGRC